MLQKIIGPPPDDIGIEIVVEPVVGRLLQWSEMSFIITDMTQAL